LGKKSCFSAEFSTYVLVVEVASESQIEEHWIFIGWLGVQKNRFNCTSPPSTYATSSHMYLNPVCTSDWCKP
jgi:hypothetical protein